MKININMLYSIHNQKMQTVTPWKVTTEGQFNYDLLIEQFGLKPINSTIIDQLETVTKSKAHYFLSRDIFYAHQDFDKILDAKAKGKDIYIYTGRGPSADSMHIGHLIPMQFAAWLQKVFDCYVVIQMSDEEKFYFKPGKLDEFMSYTKSNALDIMACDFNPSKTFIFSSFKYESYSRPIVAEINKKVTVNTMNKIYGFTENTTVGQIQWPAYQEALSLCGSFPHLFGNRKDVMCLVPCAVDQAPYFRSIRDIANQLGYPKPALICSKFLVGLTGIGDKASTTSKIPPIFLNDNSNMVWKKISKYAFSGGGETVEDHRKKGGNLSVDVPYIYLYHFLEDDNELKRIAEEYSTGKMLSGEIKKNLHKVLVSVLDKHKANRESITDAIYDDFFTMKVNPTIAEEFNNFVNKYIQISTVFYKDTKI